MSKKIMTQLKKMHKLVYLIPIYTPVHHGGREQTGHHDFSRSVWMNEKQGKYDVLQIQGIFEKIPNRLESLVTLVVYDMIAKRHK
jgi:hypothetical protein